MMKALKSAVIEFVCADVSAIQMEESSADSNSRIQMHLDQKRFTN